ncbi:MAG: glutaredoxin domain-containing protein [Chloroflexi bacterium]|nr:glutaredoxin domain-containing protein [Chloroflexota bacterium]
MTNSEIKIYGADWCGDCRRAKRFMDEHDVPYQWIDVQEDAEARELVQRLNNGKRIIPTIVFEDDSILVEPSNSELARKLGINS